jgi:hypothetical protein
MNCCEQSVVIRMKHDWKFGRKDQLQLAKCYRCGKEHLFPGTLTKIEFRNWLAKHTDPAMIDCDVALATHIMES